MDQIELSAEIRTETGKGAARKMRAAGRIPAVAYGKNLSPLQISLDTLDISKLLATGKAMRTLITLNVEGNKDIARRTLVFREIQRHHIQRDPLGADLVEIDPNKPIQLDVPLRLLGEAPGVKAGGVLQVLVRNVTINCLPAKAPDYFEADVSELDAGNTLYMGDVEIDEEIEVLADMKDPICTIIIPRGFDEEEAGEEEGEEGAEGEGAAEGEEKKEESAE